MTQQPGPPQWGPWPPPQPPPKRSAWSRAIRSYPVRALGGLVALFAGIIFVNKMNAVETAANPQLAHPRSVQTSASAPSAATGEIGPGVWLVGSDVQPGTYRTTGPASGQRYCFWSRHSNTSGGPLDDIIASDGASSGQMIVTIKASDKLFRTNDCSPFVKIS